MRVSRAVAAEDANHRTGATASATPHPQSGGRRKATASIRAWLVVSDSGRSYMEEAGKHSIMRRTGLPARDLRVLDPQLSYPSTILGRERAIVINLEHIKAVITATQVLVPNSRDPLVIPFVQELPERVSSSHRVSKHDVVEFADVSIDGTAKVMPNFQTQSGSPRHALDAYGNGSNKVLPFEFRALEFCLESACRLLESEVRDELEHLLDDDMDMAEMYLSVKQARQRDIENVELEMVNTRDEDAKTERESTAEGITGFKLNIEELEMLLEAYFVQIDGTLNKLSTLREYVDDTEDYINIMLDEKQNQLLQMGVMLSTATLVVTAGVVVVGIFGMNIIIDLFNVSTYHQFWETMGGTLGGCIMLYIFAICWGKKSGLLQ